MSRPQFTAPSATTRIEAQGTVEVNGDQTQTVSPGQSQTTRITAEAGEVWELRALRMFVPSNGSSAAVHGITCKTEAQGLEVADGDADYDVDLEYKTNQWIEPTTAVRNTDANVKIDDSNGLAIRYEVADTASNDQTNTREIRLLFDVVKA